MLPWLYYFLLLLAMLFGGVLVLLGLPGVWLMLGFVLVYAWITHFTFIGSHGLIVLLVLAAVSEIVELVAAGAAAKSAGGSNRASLGAIGGAFVGGLVATFAIPVPVIGTLIGVAAGAFIGSLLLEQSRNRDPDHLLRVGFAAAKGRLLGTVLKLVFAVVIFLVTVVWALPWR